MIAAIALLITSVLAAGSIVDVGAKAEARASFLSAQVADGFGNTLSAVGLTPSVRAAYQGQGLIVDVNYGPNLTLIYPSSDYFLLMHRWGGRVDWSVGPRLRLSVDTTGSAGDLDAGAAIRDRGGSTNLGQVLGGGNLTQFPFLDVITGGDFTYRSDARTTFNGGVRAEITGSPSPGAEEQLILPPQGRPEANVGVTWLLTPTDSLSANVLLKSAIIADERGTLGNGGGYVGATPSLSFNRTIMNGLVATTRAGWLTAVIDEGRKRDRLLVGLPLLDSRLQAAVNLSGQAAIEGTLLFGVGPFSDPLGGLLEERISAGVQGAWRINRDLTLTTSATALGTLFALGGNVELAQEAQTSVGGTFGVAYNLTEWISVTAEALTNTRVISDKFGALAELAPDLTVVVGVTGTFNAFHEGERPAGTDPRPGRSVGSRPVALPGSSRAFSGRTEEQEALEKKQKDKAGSSFRQLREIRKPDDVLDQDDVVDRRRRGLTVDEKRLQKKKTAAKEEAEAEAEKEKEKEKEKDAKKDSVKGRNKDGKKNGKKGAAPKGALPKADPQGPPAIP